MQKSGWLLAGGIVIVVIVLIALFATGAGRYGTGPGTGYGPGQSGGQGPGLGPGAGTGVNTPALLPAPGTNPLTAAESGDILFMQEEEQMAYDLYTGWAGRYSVPVFSNIAASEAMHIAEVRLLVERYGLQDRPAGNASAGYSSPVIQSLYSALADQGDASLNGAFEAGLAIEEQDIADLDRALKNTTRPDIIQVYSSLRQGSVNHRSAFLRQLGR